MRLAPVPAPVPVSLALVLGALLLLPHPALPTLQRQPRFQRYRLKESRLQSALSFISDPSNLQLLAYGDHKV